ncbi:FAD-binding protein [Chloroflexota bacterium]
MGMEISGLGKVKETDVLVLGGGAGGSMAAIGAREQGARVLVVDKGVLESCGCIGAGNDHFCAHLNTGPDWDTDEAFTKYWSRRIQENSRVVESIFTKVVGAMIRQLEEIGIEFHKDADDGYYRTQSMGMPGPWWLMIKNGKYLKMKVAEKVRQAGAEETGHIMITKLLANRGDVAGAVGFNVRDGDFYIFRAKKVVLALGGCNNARMWSTTSPNPFNTGMHPYLTGSSNVLPYDAGAKLYGIDVKGRATLMSRGYSCGNTQAFTGMGGYQLNALGERYMLKYHPMAESAPRLVQVLATYQEQIEGKGPPFYFDVRHLPKEDLEYLINNLLPVDINAFPDWLDQAGIDLRKDLLEVELGPFVSAGGELLVNEQGESSLSGLFGYPHMMLSGAFCGGYSAGVQAGKAALEARNLVEIDAEAVDKEKVVVFAPLKRDTGYTWKEYEDMIRHVMHYYMGMVRRQEGMEIALRKLGLLEQHVDEVKADNYHELLRAHESMVLLKQCQLLVRAVMERKESGRAAYKRSDYPDLDRTLDNKRLVLWQEGGEPKISFESIE